MSSSRSSAPHPIRVAAVQLEVALAEARQELEQARLSWDCLRYKLRLLEAQQNLGAAA